MISPRQTPPQRTVLPGRKHRLPTTALCRSPATRLTQQFVVGPRSVPAHQRLLIRGRSNRRGHILRSAHVSEHNDCIPLQSQELRPLHGRDLERQRRLNFRYDLIASAANVWEPRRLISMRPARGEAYASGCSLHSEFGKACGWPIDVSRSGLSGLRRARRPAGYGGGSFVSRFPVSLPHRSSLPAGQESALKHHRPSAGQSMDIGHRVAHFRAQWHSLGTLSVR